MPAAVSPTKQKETPMNDEENPLDTDEPLQIMDGVTEYTERYPVSLRMSGRGVPCVVSVNEGGYNSTRVDLPQLISWIRKNHPEFLHSTP